MHARRTDSQETRPVSSAAFRTGPSRRQNFDLVSRANRCQPSQIAPPVTTMELAVGGEQLLRSQGLIKLVGRVSSIPEQQHRRDAFAEEAAGNVAKKPTAQTSPVVCAQ